MTETNESTINVIVAMDFSDEIIQRLQDVSPKLKIHRHFPDVPESVWADTEILYTTRHFPKPEQAPLLRWIQLHSAGIEHALSEPIVQAEDVEVTSASGIHATQMANYCLMMILAFHYQLPKMLNFQSHAEWHPDRYEIFEPSDLRQQTLGIVGYGSIGRELARQAQALGMNVLASKRDVKQTSEFQAYALEGTGDAEGDIPDRLYPAEALVSMASESDYLVLTMPLTDQTRHSVNDEVFDAMKESAVLINVARGGVVDESALISALAAKKIAGAALDVFEEEPLPSSSPLWNLDNVIISPHVSGNTDDYHERVADLFAANLKRYLENEPLLNKLNRSIGY